MQSLHNKVAIITGASSGIGSAAALLFARAARSALRGKSMQAAPLVPASATRMPGYI